MSQVQSDQLQKDNQESLWTEIVDKDSSQISGGAAAGRRRCRWVRGKGLICETNGGPFGTINIQLTYLHQAAKNDLWLGAKLSNAIACAIG